MAKNPLKITDTILRDAHQSQAATRMRIEDMLPACELLDDMGYWSLECWGGATFDACMRFLNEDPWERLRALKKAMPKTKLQMLLRGQNILGYKHYADDVVEEFVKKSIQNGIDVVRIFDALNDPRNMAAAMKYTSTAASVKLQSATPPALFTTKITSLSWLLSCRRWALTLSVSKTWQTCCCLMMHTLWLRS